MRPVLYVSLFIFLLLSAFLHTGQVERSLSRSGRFFVRHADDGFDWQTLETDTLRLHWYQGDASFGGSALEAASAGLESIDRLMPLDLAQPVEIFIYANADDLGGTLASGSGRWMAGHADPALGVVMVVIEPGAEQGIAMEQRIPHELAHVMLYRYIGPGYHNIPAWLREGMATLAELYPNPDYDRALADAAAKSTLIPLEDLCVSFPSDTGQAFLAYAESRSFTGYLYELYGSSGLLNLAASHAEGVGCTHGTERAFGISFANLEAKWRSSVLNQNPLLSAMQTISPYLVLLCLVLLIPIVSIAGTLRRKGSHDERGSQGRK